MSWTPEDEKRLAEIRNKERRTIGGSAVEAWMKHWRDADDDRWWLLAKLDEEKRARNAMTEVRPDIEAEIDCVANMSEREIAAKIIGLERARTEAEADAEWARRIRAVSPATRRAEIAEAALAEERAKREATEADAAKWRSDWDHATIRRQEWQKRAETAKARIAELEAVIAQQKGAVIEARVIERMRAEDAEERIKTLETTLRKARDHIEWMSTR